MSSVQIIALVIWGLIIIASIIVEVLTEELLSIWFAISAAVALILSLFGVEVYIQIVLFSVLSVVLFIFFRSLIKKISKNADVATNLDRAIGQIGLALNEFKAGEKGEVRVNFQTWTAISNSDIEKNEKVVISRIDGNKLVVEKIHEYEIK